MRSNDLRQLVGLFGKNCLLRPVFVAHFPSVIIQCSLLIIACSPIYSKLSESLLGLSTIRSFGREKMVQGHFQECLNQHSKISYLYFVVLRWFSMRIDFLTTLLLATVAFSCIPLASSELIYSIEVHIKKKHMLCILCFVLAALDPGLVGLSLMYTTSLCTSFQYAMLLSTELENTVGSKLCSAK